MYFQAHADGRGAKLNSYDTNVVREVHPFNTPPYSYDRVMDATDASTQPVVAGINEIELRGYDLQSTTLSFLITNVTAPHGTFGISGSLLKFTPNVFANGSRTDPAGTGYFEYVYARFSDGTNASPYNWMRVVSLAADTDSTSDGIPDSWMTAYFAHTDPQSGDKSRASDDKDGDGMINLQEYRVGMYPTNSTYAQRVTLLNSNTLQFQAKAYELYEIQSSTNLASPNWTRIGNPIVPTNATLAARTSILANPITATVSNLPVSGNQLFFRVVKVP
jgi:hypothetical protein